MPNPDVIDPWKEHQLRELATENNTFKKPVDFSEYGGKDWKTRCDRKKKKEKWAKKFAKMKIF